MLRTILLVALFVSLGGGLLVFGFHEADLIRQSHRGSIEEERTGKESGDANFSLPGEGFDASRILGRTRSEVRLLLGAPELSSGDTEVFHLDVKVQVHFQGERANSLVLGAPRIARHERYVRRWLHLPGDGPLTMGGKPLQLALFVGDDDRIGVELTPEELPLGTPSPAPVRAVARAPGDPLLKSFPKIPEKVRARCREQGRSGHRGLDCGGYDSGLSYEVSDEQQPQTITLLDPPGATTPEKCRAVLLDSLPSLASTRQQKEPPLTEKEFFGSDSLEGMVVWTPAFGFKKQASCVVVACVKGSQRGSCSPH